MAMRRRRARLEGVAFAGWPERSSIGWTHFSWTPTKLRHSTRYGETRRAPFTTAGFARMVERAGAEAVLGFKAHPHMLRHACGYALANKGHDPAHCKPI